MELIRQIYASMPEFKEFGKRGGQTRAKKLTAKQRKAIAKRAAQARWGKKRSSS